MLIIGTEPKSENDVVEKVCVDLVITSEGMPDRRLVATSTTSSFCDVKSIAARRKRLEIRRFRNMAASGCFTVPPAKRLKVNGTVVCELKMELRASKLEEARTGEECVTDTAEREITAPIHVEVRSQFNSSLEGAASREVAAHNEVREKSGCIEASPMDCADFAFRRAADGAAGMNGSELGEKVVDGKREIMEKATIFGGATVFGEGLRTNEVSERRVGSVEWWRRSERPPEQLCCPDFGTVSVCGRRREMEDAAVVVPGFLTLPSGAGLEGRGAGDCVETYHFFGVYDGHGGAQVAEFCKERLHAALADEMNLAARGGSGNRAEDGDKWETAMVASFQRVDAEISGICTREPACTRAEGQTRCCVGPLAPGTVGSTAIVAIVGGGRIVVGNCGDSRAVLCRGGRCIPLSRDHKPGRPDEMARIEAAGGRVISWNGCRVLGVLAMSRAIGDRYLKPFVIPVPEITSTFLSDEDECLILASDGLWDVLANDEVCDVTRRYLSGSRSSRQFNCVESEESPAEAAAALLTKLALAKNSRDNISVVVVDLKVYPL